MGFKITGRPVPMKTILAILLSIGCLFGLSYYANGINQENNLIKHRNEKYSEPKEDVVAISILKTQRNEVSKLLNDARKKYGQQNCQMMQLKKGDVSEFGGWCKEISSPDSKSHATDQPLLEALSSFLASKTVGSLGDGPGLYKLGIDKLGEVKSYTAYDGAPFCEEVTSGRVNFLDLSVPHYGLPVFDWVLSFEVGEHIPKQFEDVFLDNVVRHAREGVVLSWAVIGQGGHSHINNKNLVDVVAMMEKRGFVLNEEKSTELRNKATLPWLKQNIRVYFRKDVNSIVFDDA